MRPIIILFLSGFVQALQAGEFVPADGPPIKDQYIVVLRDEMPPQAREGLLRALAGSSLKGVYQKALNGGVVTMPQQRAEALARNPNVAYVEQDATVWASATQLPAVWGLDRIDQAQLPLNNLYNYTQTGSGVTAYVIDTGVRYDHVDLAGRATPGIDVFGGDGSDCNGHGSHVAGTIGGMTYGVAKSVNLVSVRVLDCNGSGSISGVIAGVDWVTVNHYTPAVANMSLGGGASTSLDTAVTNSIRSGVTYAIAAGNAAKDACLTSPARIRETGALTVGATTSTDARASYSNYGKCLDLFAPGSSITSIWNTGTTASNTISGTSMATPHVAGVAALYLEKDPSATPASVRNAVVAVATRRAVSAVGRNSPDALLYSVLP